MGYGRLEAGHLHVQVDMPLRSQLGRVLRLSFRRRWSRVLTSTIVTIGALLIPPTPLSLFALVYVLSYSQTYH